MDERHKRSNRNSTIILSGRTGGRDEDRNGWREGWQASAEARSLTTVRKGAQARSPINYNLDPPLFSSLSLTHFLLHSTILPLPLILPWSLSSAPINQSLLPPLLPPLAISHLPPPTMPLSLSLSALLFIPRHSSPSFHRWKCSGSRKVRGGQTRGRERGRGNKGV